MADDQFQIGSGNWWEPSRNRFDSRSSSSPSPPSSSSSSSALTSSTATASFGWPAEIADLKIAAARSSSMDSASVSATSISMVNFQDTQKLQVPHSSSLLPDPNLQIMGLGLSSQAIDWNQTSSLVVGGGKAESSFRQVLQEDLNPSSNFQQETGMGSSHQEQWRQKIYSGGSEDSSVNRGFSLDQSRFSPHISSGDGAAGFQMDPVAYGSPSTLLLQGLLGSDHSQQQQPPSTFENRPMNYPYHPPSYNNIISSGELLPSFSKFPQFLRGSPDPPKQPLNNNTTPLHFSNSTPFWNPTAAASINDVRSSFFPSLQPQFPPPTFDEKPKNNTSEVRDLGTAAKKSTSEASSKRPRSETAPPLPAFKVRKEKMGDRITALQQLVSPFGKTDTASVLSEAIEYIKFLHEQVSVLSTPYMKSSGASIQHQQNSEKSKDPEGPKQDLRSRGLCLVPVSSTFAVTQETTVDFWTPTFGGTYR